MSSEAVSLNDIFKTVVSSPERAKAIERQQKLAKMEMLLEGDGDAGFDPMHEPVATAVVEPSSVSRNSIPSEAVAPVRNDDSILISNSKVPVQLTVTAGHNVMSGAPTTFTLSFEAHDVQVSEDMISILYKHAFAIMPPAFTQVKLKIRSTSYNAMCISAARKLGPFTDMSFVIVQTNENGEESSS